MTAAGLSDLELILRGGACGVLVLVAVLLLRDHRGTAGGRLGALFALSGAAYAISTALGEPVRWWAAPILALTAGGNVAFWLFARALFEDGFRPRLAHGALWLAIALVGVVQGLVLVPLHFPAAAYVAAFLTLETLAFVGLTTAQVIAARGGDLVEPRRRLRLYVVVIAVVYVGAKALSDLFGAAHAAPLASHLAEAAGLVVVVAGAALALLRIHGGEVLFPRRGPAAPPSPPVSADPVLATALDKAMNVERLYRRDGLTIGALAAHLGLPEHRLRRLINQELGYRNFAAFLNGRRLEDARQALADPDQAEVPILTIALDAGFASLGPFNRAFKAETGQTPSQFRRTALAVSGIGQP